MQKQLRDILSFLKTNIIAEQVIKHAHKAEADRFYNFPHAAVEEALANAVYHKSYELGSPIEVQIWPDKIEILSYPGPVPPVDATILKNQQRIVVREYRNRRIGDFLKELHLTEGRGTGVPGIYRAMAQNGSPPPTLDTDADRNYFLTILPVHALMPVVASHQVTNRATSGAESFVFNGLDELMAYANGATNGATNGANASAITIVNTEMHERVAEILEILIVKLKRGDLFEKMALTNQTFNREKYLDPLVKCGWIALSHPDNLTHPNQTYQTTQAGKRILSLLN